MAQDIEKLIVQMSADIRGFEKEMARLNRITSRQFNAIEKKARQFDKNLDNIPGRV